MALPSSDRFGARVIWVTLHTAEGSRRTGDLYNFFNNVQNSSSHAGVDGFGLADGWVPPSRAAWTLLNGNARSMNLEMCGFARWSRAQWLSTGMVDGVTNPRQMVRNAARWAKQECERFGIPKVHIGADGVRRGASGIIMHYDYTIGARDGDHSDIGQNFPWDVFFADMGGTSTEEDDMFTDKDRAALSELWKTVVSGEKRDSQINKDLGFVRETVLEVVNDIQRKVADVFDTTVSGNKRDARLVEDNGFIRQTVIDAVNAARDAVLAKLSDTEEKPPPPA